MRVSQRLDYALRALVLLADQPEGDMVAAGDLADHLGLPRRFVEQQITALARAGLVTCRRGSSGGCSLALSPADVSVKDVVVALQGEVLDVPRQAGSSAAELWQSASEQLASYLARVSIADLVARQRQLDSERSPMYYI